MSTIRYLLRSHNEGVFKQVEANNGADGRNCPKYRLAGEEEDEGQGNQVAEGDAAEPEVTAVSAVTDVVGGAGGDFAGVGDAELAGQGDEEVNDNGGDEGDEGDALHYWGDGEQVEDEQCAAAGYEGLDNQMEGQEGALPEVAAFGLGKEEGGVNSDADGEGEAEPEKDGSQEGDVVVKEVCA